MSILFRIAERALNRPLLVHPDKVPLILGILDGRIPLGDISELRREAEARIDRMPEEAQRVMRGPAPDASQFVGSYKDANGDYKPFLVTKDGIANIAVIGSLINRGAWLGSSSGETSYEGIKFQLAQAAADPNVKGILLDIESPGGEAVGAMEAAQAVRDAAAQKPVYAVVNGMAASAAYAIASGATKIVTTPSGVVGSIGVVLLHADYSRALDKAGITPTLIFAGDHKVDANPFAPLPDNVRADLQAEVQQFYDLFVQTVAAGRRGMSPAAIRGTQARTFIGEEAVKQGLADEVGTFESALSDLTSTARARASTQGRSNMKTEDTKPVVGTISQADHEAAVAAARTEGHAAGKVVGIKEGATAENMRLNTILGSDKVKGKKKSALQIATAMPDATADKVIEIVAALPASVPAAATISERAGGQGALVALGTGATKPADAATAGWNAAAAAVNKQFGVAAK
jgi:signal peptide peptidase SppA